MKKVLVINANPKQESLCQSLAEHYASIAGKKHDIKQVNLADMSFEMDLQQGYDKETPLEDDLKGFQQHVTWAEHIVIVSPVWWGTIPAKFKGVIDRTFLPGFAFKYQEGKSIPQKLLSGRTSELIITLDTPPFWYKYVQGNPIYKQLKHTILSFTGIKNQTSIYLGPVLTATEQRRQSWFDKISKRAAQL
ncbi:NAD(P)H-dependent oxidoreductase [Photobacterium sp. DNB23_23_1]|uniref:NAD(P)H-dependent oxidoreductase n=1 Tax=Photobacterium pectinilyticum TaxID=2906793 RepID=A0ABT1N3Z2_9GAMM|nr:NAD(P)H-dependent oxidoreductase [Photobacterium sp. ZSDE20]MCQ1057969.1 NAD(P)H-dependent oxidoreductase [Photobacterium sp. ZSDE20]MDD1822501.1 NAD(P)H-dependent oxidoreductase [Photobacterium sp. ZSDE20]